MQALMNVVGGAGITSFLALVGRTRPGTFLKSTAYLSAATTSYAALDAYGRREVNRAIFKLDNVEPKPGKLWERTKRWTVDDVVLGGGMFATLLVLNPKALPGVGGWKRFLGAATVGCAAGYYVGETVIMPVPGVMSMLHDASVKTRDAQYARLKEDIKAQDALSRFGKLALSYYTSPFSRISINSFRSGPQAGSHAVAGGTNSYAEYAQQYANQHFSINIEFEKGELDGPDIEAGFRVYQANLSNKDKDGLQDWLERLERMHKERCIEARYLLQRLKSEEQTFYTMQTDDREKEIFRRKLQLLNNLTSDYSARVAILEHHITDANKRLELINQDAKPISRNYLTEKKFAPEPPGTDQMINCDLQSITDRIRRIWSDQKTMLGHLDENLTRYKDFEIEPGSPLEAQLKKMQKSCEQMKLNTEGTERLLGEFEDLVRSQDR
jgi:hypothetical protein